MNWKKAFQLVCAGMQSMPFKWFFCFGTMLAMIRDKGKFEEGSDIDVGVFFDQYEDRYTNQIMKAFCFSRTTHIIHDVTGKCLYQSFFCGKEQFPDLGELHLDIFAWIKVGKFYYHTYDLDFEKPKDGIPKRYVFKGVPAEYIDAGLQKVEQCGGSMLEGWIPKKYGTLLDEWYPDWAVPRKTVSQTRHQIECKSCAELTTGKFKKTIWTD
jgi:hypothetical protein